MQRTSQPLMRRVLLGVLGTVVCWSASMALAAGSDDIHKAMALYCAATAPSVVYITAFIEESSGLHGAGVVINGDGLILARLSSVWDARLDRPAMRVLAFYRPEGLAAGAKDMSVYEDVSIFAKDKTRDLVLLKPLRREQKRPALALATTAGTSPLVLGYGFAKGRRWSVALGRLEGAGKRVAWALDARLNGAPVLDVEGRVLGLLGRSEPGSESSVMLDAASVRAWLAALKLKTDGLPLTGVNVAPKDKLEGLPAETMFPASELGDTLAP